MSVFSRAATMLHEAEALGRPPRGVAMPFGVIEPECRRWRLSSDLWEEVEEVLGSGTGAELHQSIALRLFGIMAYVDAGLPPNSMILERTA